MISYNIRKLGLIFFGKGLLRSFKWIEPADFETCLPRMIFQQKLEHHKKIRFFFPFEVLAVLFITRQKESQN